MTHNFASRKSTVHYHDNDSTNGHPDTDLIPPYDNYAPYMLDALKYIKA